MRKRFILETEKGMTSKTSRMIASFAAAVILTVNLLPIRALAETIDQSPSTTPSATAEQMTDEETAETTSLTTVPDEVPATESPETAPAVSAQATSSSTAPSLSETSTVSTSVVGGTDDTYNVTVSVKATSGSSTTESAKKDIIFLVDTSGSMYGTPLDSVKTALKNFVNQVSTRDSSVHFGLISYNDMANVDAPLTNDVSSVDAAIDTLRAGGSSELTGALTEAKDEFARNGREGSDTIIIVLSDGDDWHPDLAEAAAQDLVNSYPNATIDTIGYGSSADENFLKKIAATSKTGTYSSSETDAINGVLAGIGSTITTNFSSVKVTSPKPDRFTLVPGSFSTSDGLTLDQDAFDNDMISVTSGPLAGGESISFSYSIKIDQDAAAKAAYLHNVMDYTATGEYVLNGETLSASADSSLDAPIYLISTSTDGNGTISASRFVGQGASYGVTWTANAGYVITSLSENGSALSAEGTTGSLSVGPVSSDVAVKASFAATTTSPTPTSMGGASVTQSPLPQTGDDSPWAAVAMSACIVLFAGVVTRRRGMAA